MARYTSRVFVAAEAISTKLTAASFTAHPATGKAPVIVFGDSDPEMGSERIGVALNADETQANWARLGPPGRDEVLFFDVWIRSWTAGHETSAAAWDRLESLAGTVQDIFFNTATPGVVALGYTGEELTTVVGVRPSVWPIKEHGWVGDCIVTLRTVANI